MPCARSLKRRKYGHALRRSFRGAFQLKEGAFLCVVICVCAWGATGWGPRVCLAMQGRATL